MTPSEPAITGKNEQDTSQSSASEARIAELRTSIDEIDTQILDLINRRLLLGKEIGSLKNQDGKHVLDTSRENIIMQQLCRLNRGPLPEKALYHIFGDIISASRAIQRPQTIGYLGPEATFTHIAAMNHFGHSTHFVSQASIRDIFTEVEKGSCHYGVVPVENSIEGAVNHTLDLFFDSDLKICAEIYQPISHDLLSNARNLKEVKTIYSHPQAFAQCRTWIRKHLPNAVFKESSSTAWAAKKAAEEAGTAAIAGSEAAVMYDLKVLAPKIEDFHKNTTRFLVIGHDEMHRSGNDKTTFIFVTAHVPGALSKVLDPVAEAGINMVKLESRPTKYENWSYFFIMDIEGHIEDPKVEATIAELQKVCLFLKHLGSYPKAA